MQSLVRASTFAAVLVLNLVGLVGAAWPQEWRVGIGEGTKEATVTGDRGTLLDVICNAGQQNPTAGLTFVHQAPLPGLDGSEYEVSLRTEGASHQLPMVLVASVVLAFNAEDAEGFSALNAIAVSMSAGQRLVVEAPELGWREEFPLRNANVVLAGHLEGCER